MDEAEDSKCQTMKDTRKRRTFSNDQAVGINTAMGALVCRKTAALRKKKKKRADKNNLEYNCGNASQTLLHL